MSTETIIRRVYVVHLQGQGDVDVRVVDQETWDWINGPVPSGAQRTWHEPIPGKTNLAYCSASSFQNDRAIQCKGRSFDSLRKALAFIERLELSLGDTFEGYIY
jgi:hypothetical protein